MWRIANREGRYRFRNGIEVYLIEVGEGIEDP
jgi:hypothetical protein